MSPTGSTLARRMLGRQLRALRISSGVSAEYARDAINVGKQTLWRIETGQPVRLNPLFIERLCQIYGASEAMTAILLELTEETKHTGWWHAFGDTIHKEFSLYVELEAAAKRIVSYQTTLLPGLLQTDECRRALIWASFPGMSGAEVERRIEMFGRRRTRLDNDSDPLLLEAILDESALRRAIGGRAVMEGQLRHLLRVSEQPNVSVRVVPLASETYAGLSVGSFVMLDFPKHPTAHLTEPPVVYIQGFTGNLYLEKPEEIRQYRQAHAELQRSALDQERSRSLIRKIAKEYGQ
ncbi:helix-turn-helix domain-containing protein [Nocardia sp. NBC_00508]|uniref:helix-turn-helix domain-containing protein n=1 Tax=Nocardia sp. NBC_00508 TaxID=2975992 RepID=UPI002E824A03|nr:helix-turn-helix transcriptional regulator [Nocardia sp. NBC_00508]WUD65041.1 helix-turn-helix domain-containing protein [Nocardia sp. NBC_00508]